ncbi:MAG: diaminopimelate decarboxylase [Desulfobulbus propionicus]|nr:MAG: diaminopimelate decarboxylase [Desulfobulbus propionicus]
MHHFSYTNGQLHCEEVSVEKLAAAVGTPFYLYSTATLTRHFQAFDTSFSGREHLVCFAVKACSNLGILNLLARLGAGADIVSGGELYRALKAGIQPGKIVFSGVGKTSGEIREALFAGILMFNVESSQELDRIQNVAEELGTVARIAFRVNPDIDARTHRYISTGLAENKFGLPVAEAREQYRRAAGMKNIEVAGISCHIGSQVTQLGPFADALGLVRQFIEELMAEGIAIDYLDMGGGVGITYENEEPPHPREYAQALAAGLDGLNCTLIFEPGRVITGNAGILVTEVQYTKTNAADQGEKRFIIVDAAMNDLSRPSLYGAYHEILPVVQGTGDKQTVDIVGPVCESGDFLAKERQLGPVAQGDLLAVMSCGAYGFSMSSNYNSRPRVAEVLVDGSGYHIVRKREDYDDLIRGETLMEPKP